VVSQTQVRVTNLRPEAQGVSLLTRIAGGVPLQYYDLHRSLHGAILNSERQAEVTIAKWATLP
jgi:hypothetical protein